MPRRAEHPHARDRVVARQDHHLNRAWSGVLVSGCSSDRHRVKRQQLLDQRKCHSRAWPGYPGAAVAMPCRRGRRLCSNTWFSSSKSNRARLLIATTRRPSSVALMTAGTSGTPGCRFLPHRDSPAWSKRRQSRLIRLGHLQPDQDAAVVRTLVAVVEQADVPARAHQVQKLEQRARPLRKHETQQSLIFCKHGMPAHHVPDMFFGQIIVGQVNGLKAVPAQVRGDLARLTTRRPWSSPTNTCAFLASLMR
jgi:hypothetical protein